MNLTAISVYSIYTHTFQLLSIIDSLSLTVSTLITYFLSITISHSSINTISSLSIIYSQPLSADTSSVKIYTLSTTINSSLSYYSTLPHKHYSSLSDSTTLSINSSLDSYSQSVTYDQESNPILFYFPLSLMASMMILSSSYTLIYLSILQTLSYLYYETTCYSSY